MARIVKRPGDLLMLPLSKQGRHAYCQWLPDGTARFFLASCTTELKAEEIIALPAAFRVVVFNDTPNRYKWAKAGKAEIPAPYMRPQSYAKKDAITGKLSIYTEGNEIPATPEEVKGLETMAVWAHPHIVERLEAQLEGKESMFFRSISVVA
jgi:hypothetical protein